MSVSREAARRPVPADAPDPPDGTAAPGTPVRAVQFICPRGMYGAERWILTLVRHLDPAWVATTVVTLGDAGAAAVSHRLAEHGLRTRHIGRAGKLSFRALAELRGVLRDEGAEIVHSHGFKSDVLGFLATRGLRIAAVTTPHGWSADEGLRIAAYESLGRAVTRRFDAVYPLSRTLEQDLVARGFRRERVRCLYNGVDDTPLTPLYRERSGQSTPRGVLLFVGRLCLAKGVLDLVEAFAAAELPGAPVLWIVGDGPLRDEIVERVRALGLAARVRVWGYVDDIIPLLRGADAVVLPSHSEGIPRVLMEACAAGVPTIATDLPGIRELITHEHSGLLVPARDPGALARALERLYRDPGCVPELIRNARATIDRSFNARRLALEMQHEYVRLARSAGGRGEVAS